MMKNNKKGFTLAELLIVVAIIAVLVAIAIPVFTTQLEKSREATDLANIRSAYAEVMAEVLSDGTKTVSAEVELKQVEKDWQYVGDQILAGVTVSEIKDTSNAVVDRNGKVEVKYDPAWCTADNSGIQIGGTDVPRTKLNIES